MTKTRELSGENQEMIFNRLIDELDILINFIFNSVI